MAKRQLSIQDSVDTEDEFNAYLEANSDKLICMEVYSEFCGYCLAMGNAVKKAKLEIGGDSVAMVKACADNIPSLERFRYKSEPLYILIIDSKLTGIVFGANGIELCRMVEEQLELMKVEAATGKMKIARSNIDELMPAEIEKKEEELKLDAEYQEAAERLKVLTLAARKKRVCDRLSMNIKRLNFIMFWPQHHQAHYDLYEKWDELNINVAAKEEFQLTEETAKEVLYMSDVELNEACLHHLTDGQVMVTLFKMFDTDDRDFVKLIRHSLYEEIPVANEDDPPEKQLPPIPAFQRYASISKTAREVRRQRYNAKLQRQKEAEEEAERYRKETERLARVAEEDRIKAEKQKRDDERMARLAAGLPASPEPEPEPEVAEEAAPEEVEGADEGAFDDLPPAEGEVEGEAVEGEVEPEATPEEAQPEVFNSDVEVEGEDYIPPGGLFVPGIYSPPNELAKANALKFFFPKIIQKYAPLETEHLPPHVLVMFPVDKRHEISDVIKLYQDEILNMGFFLGEDPYHAEHVAYSVKQYDKMVRLRKHLDRLAVMVSRKRSLPLLQLAGLNPIYISSDLEAGERDCLTLFPVGYGDDFEEEESVKEEEIPEVVVVKEEVKEEANPEEAEEEEDEELDI